MAEGKHFICPQQKRGFFGYSLLNLFSGSLRFQMKKFQPPKLFQNEKSKAAVPAKSSLGLGGRQGGNARRQSLEA